MQTINVYSINELEVQFPQGYTQAFENWRMRIRREASPWSSEIADSFKAVFKAAGVTLKSWSITAYNTCKARVEFSNPEAENLVGKRAMAWLENHLFSNLRLPFSKETLRKRGYRYHAGHIPVCSFTGVCFDEDMLDYIRQAARDGEDLKNIFVGLADVAGKLLEQEEEEAECEEAFKVDCDYGGWMFTESGLRVAD